MRFKLRSKKTDLTKEPKIQKQTASLESITKKLQNYKSTEGKANFSCRVNTHSYRTEELDIPLNFEID